MTSSGAGADRLESNVRYYSRHMPQVFATARGSEVFDDKGRRYLDFLSACGSLNYGHNEPGMKAAAIDYLAGDGVLAAMDLRTTARLAFIADFEEAILRPRGLDYRLQFTGPTGANAVEAALKLARKATGRTQIVAFTNAFHGVSLGALAATGSRRARAASSALLGGVIRLSYEGYHGAGVEELDRYAAAVADPSGGVEPPAAFIVETVQGEGGLNVASKGWLRRLAEVARSLGALLIVDDVQAGCGRTGTFFSFERAGIEPDVVCLAKSLSGSGLPMALALIKPERDVWEPAEHNGTFRGNSLAFVTASKALDHWRDHSFAEGVASRGARIDRWSREIAVKWPERDLSPVGLGMMRGLRFAEQGLAAKVARNAFDRGVMIETAGPRDEALKLMPALNIPLDLLEEGLCLIAAAIAEALSEARMELVA